MIKENISNLTSEMNSELSAIASDFEQQRNAVRARSEAQINSLRSQVSMVQTRFAALDSLSGSLMSAISQITGVTAAQAMTDIQSAISIGRAGGDLSQMDLSSSIQALTRQDASGFGSAVEQARSRALTVNSLNELNELTKGQLSEAEQNILLLESQIETIEKSTQRQIDELNKLQAIEEEATRERFESQISELENIADTAREELNALLGIDDSVQSLTGAMNAFAEAVQAASQNQAGAQAELIAQINDRIDNIKNNPTQPSMPNINLPAQELTKEQMESMNEALKVIAVSTTKSAKLMNRWDGDGQPEIRNVS